MPTHFIPDIHGQAAKLDAALHDLGFRVSAGTWSHPEGHDIVFLGDFIDRGRENARVLGIVRGLIESGIARAVLGNHELNAIHFHTPDPDTGLPLRSHRADRVRQHASFLEEFPIGAPETAEILAWMRGLPLFIEEEGFRAVHAAWDGPSIDALPGPVLSEDEYVRAGRKGDPLKTATEMLLKGPEAALPDGYAFRDKDSNIRRKIRLRWWQGGGERWRDIAMSIPSGEESRLPPEPVPACIAGRRYPADARPIFFGHYWLRGPVMRQAPNALCLDYSAGCDGPLVTYSFEPGDRSIDLARIRIHRSS